MEDPRIPQRFTRSGETGLLVEARRVRLSVQARERVAAPPGLRGERRQQLRARTAPAHGRENRHSADLDGRRIDLVETARADRFSFTSNQGVNGERVRPIVLVDLEFGRNALLLDEHAKANGERVAQPA